MKYFCHERGFDMIHTYAAGIRRTVAMLLAVLLLCLTPVSALAEKMVVNTNSRVYRSATLASQYAALKKGTEVNLLATWNGWARIEKNGAIGYTNASHLSPVQTIDYDALMANAQEAVIVQNTRVYQSASTSSRSLSVKKGMKVNLLAVNGQWALVENAGIFAFMNAAHVSTDIPKEPDYAGLIANAKPVVINCNTRVFQSASLSARWLNVYKGMKVNLLAVNGQWAMVENSGCIAYMNVDHLSSQEAAPTPTPVPTPTPEPVQPDYSGYLKNAQAALVNQNTRVYRFADLSSSYVDVSKGTAVQLLAVNSGWALVERGGSYGFTNSDHVTVVPAATPTPAPTATPTPKPTATPAVSADYLNSSKYTNEEKCYLFMVKEMGLNSAAACGILANIRKESSFNPASGSSYYGLCQWGGGRLTNLKKFCDQNGYSHSSLEGQLRFLHHELKNSYPKILNYLLAVDNTADGAYDAGHHFCYEYERPANKASVSVSRGNLARDTYFPKYN